MSAFESGDEHSKTPYLHPGESDGSVTIKRCLTASNHGFIYLATGISSGRPVFLQEYFPTGVAKRNDDCSVSPVSRKKNALFEEGLTQFLQDARTLSQINEPHIAHVQQYMENNGTAYMTIDGDHGQLLSEHLKHQRERFSEEDIRQLLFSLMKGLSVIHERHVYHRDIHPGHIFLRDIGPALLLGFGANSQHIPAGANRGVLSEMATTGYSPVERYQLGGRIGPSTDLYSLGAVIYRCITGITPVEAKRRVAASIKSEDDPLVPAREVLRGKYSSGFLGVVDWMLQPIASDRPDSVQTVLGLLARSRMREDNKRLQPITKVVDNTKIDAPPARAPMVTSEDKPKVDVAATPISLRTALPIHRLSKRVGWISWAALGCVVLVTILYFGFRSPVPPIQNGEQESIANEISKELPAEKKDATADEKQASIAPDEAEKEIPGSEVTDLINSEDSVNLETPDVELTRPNDNERMLAYREQDFLDATVESHLEKAAGHVKEGQLIQPAGDNALDAYRAALVLDPGNIAAIQGIDGILDTMLGDARVAFTNDDLETANRILVQIELIQPDHYGASELRNEIANYALDKEKEIAAAKAAQQREIELEEQRAVVAAEKAKNERRQQIEVLFKKANDAFSIERFTLPDDDNALLYYRQILKLEPENRVALAGIDKIQDAYLDFASKSIIQDQFENAQKYLELAESINQEAPEINRLREQLLARKTQIAQQQSKQTTVQSADQPTVPTEPEKITTPETTASSATTTTVTAATTPAPTNALSQGQQSRLIAGADAYYRGDYQVAYNLLKPLSDADNPRAKFRMAMMYSSGRGVPKSTALARELSRQAFPAIQKAASGGRAWAQADMGSIYEDGLIVLPNITTAVGWYRLAAEQGYPGAQTNLGVLYANGEGVVQDTTEAVAWLQRAASQGDKIARDNLRALGVN